MKNKFIHIAIQIILFCQIAVGQYSITGIVMDQDSKPIEFADVFEASTGKVQSTDESGAFTMTNLPKGIHELTFYSFEHNTITKAVAITSDDVRISISLTPLSTSLSEVEIRARKKELFGLKRLKAVEGTAIYEGKKSEVVLIEQLVGNIAANNPRQIYAQVAGLNIYENSDAGLQLNVGGRGLDPNRSANFNTRQDGYDISADVLGYPESYYTPAAQGLSEIQVVKGSASLQYGTQFGGLINFKMKDAPLSDGLGIGLSQTVGSFGMLGTFIESGGRSSKLSYYGYYNYKRADGYRANSGYSSHNAFGKVKYDFSQRTSLSFEATYLSYLAQQAGGLTDSQFDQDPRQSTRNRNWFEVDWKLYNMKLEHHFTKKTIAEISVFGLDAKRNTVGYRGNPLSLNTNPITDLDEQSVDGNYLSPRDIIAGTFQNWGVESRLLHTYRLGQQDAVLLVGMKYYSAENTSIQGAGSTGTDADFSLRNEEFSGYPNQSIFEFPNRNLAFFGEHIWKVNDKLSITPGVRFEYIKTASRGEYRRILFDAAGNPISNITLDDNNELPRTLFLAGVGVSYKPRINLELYGNLSQNYRSITFSDIRTVSPTFIIDPDIADEKGYTADLGYRGNVGKELSFDVGVFSLLYNNRIGIILDDRANRVRTNIGSAIIYGIESYIEWNIMKSVNPDITDRQLSLFANTSLTDSRYLSSELNPVESKKVEFIPRLNLKSGAKIGYKNLLISLQATYLSQQFTDAENSAIAQVGDAREGIIGEIPAYYIFDLSLTYVYKRFELSAGINNLTNNAYFTRRATGYPGPGIIPGDGRGLYIGLGWKFQTY